MSKEQKQRTLVGLMSAVILCVAALSIRFTVNTVAQTPGDADAQIADADGDGVKDYEEAAYGTDPNNADSDGDGFFDDQELAFARDPLNPNEYPDVETAVIRFDGPQNRSSYGSDLEPSTAVSLVGWVQAGENASLRVVAKGSYSLEIRDGSIVFDLRIAGQHYPLFTKVAIQPGEWHQVAAVYDGEAMRNYFDGKLAGVGHINGGIDPARDELALGDNQGAVVDVRVYRDRALQEGDVALLFENGNPEQWFESSAKRDRGRRTTVRVASLR